MDERAPLPPLVCGTCSACCHKPPALLADEDPTSFSATRRWNSATKNWDFQLPAAPDGSCIFRHPTSGCLIYDGRPSLCRQFDCRKWFRAFSRSRRHELARSSEVPESIWLAAKTRGA